MTFFVSKTICVIGSGICGLSATKECKAAGLNVTCYELEAGLGGVWRFTESESRSSVYRSTHINTGRDVSAWGGFPVPPDLGTAVHHSGVLQYITRFAERFDLLRHIKFGHEVVRLTKDGAVTVTNKTSGVTTTVVYDAVIVATGHHAVPRMPSFPGSDSFRGSLTHSHTYKDAAPYVDKHVIVVGIGNSGSDVVTEVSKVAKSCTLVARRGAYVIPNKFMDGSMDHISRAEQIISGMVPRSVGAFLMYHLVFKLAASQRIVNEKGLTPVGRPTVSHRMRINESHPTMTLNFPGNNLIQQLKDDKIVVKRGIDRFMDKNIVVFNDGSVMPFCDAVIMCTGYRVENRFVSPDIIPDRSNDNNTEPLYKYIFPPNVPRVAFMGMMQPLGSMFMIGEAQARLIAAVYSGRIPLPSPTVMRSDAAQHRALAQSWFLASPRHTLQVAVTQYCDEIGEILGTTPTLLRLLRTSGGYRFLVPAFCTATTNHTYRLVGPGACPSVAVPAMWAEHAVAYRNSKNLSWVWICIRFIVVVLFFVWGFVTQIYFKVRYGRTIDARFN